MFFDDGLAGAEGYDEHVQGLDIHQLGLVNGISEPITLEYIWDTKIIDNDWEFTRHNKKNSRYPKSS